MWLREEIESIKKSDPAARSSLEIILTYPGLHALIVHKISSGMRKNDLHLLARLVSHLGRFLTGIEIHPGAVIGKRFFIDHGMGVVIGETAVVGDDVTIYQGVTLGGTGKQKGKRHPTVGNGVVIGAGAKILGAVTIGDGARIGGGAVVLKDVPPYTTAVGVPARAVAWTHPESGESRRLEKLPDPNLDSILAMVQRIEEQDEKIRRMEHDVEETDRSIVGSWQI
jgi:serine O-acetyltransferase